MIWVIAIIAVILFAIYEDWWWSWGEAILLTGLLLIAALLLAFLICMLCSCFTSYSPHCTVIETTEIIAMHDGSEVNGRVGGGIFCASGYIDEEPIYKVLIKTDKGLQTKTYKASESYVQFTNEIPRVETRRVEAIGFWNFFCGDGFLDKHEYIIYIPEDSVVANDYVLDLQ